GRLSRPAFSTFSFQLYTQKESPRHGKAVTPPFDKGGCCLGGRRRRTPFDKVGLFKIFFIYYKKIFDIYYKGW
ncbi:MAG: hypothetical protein IJA17_07195, partial [Oscillospiraceae bacterium]|nr:hypothetical protein [Oscillospiraceae bacterium]